jgi:hypothetical protein
MKFEYNYQIILNEHNRPNKSNSKYLKNTLTYVIFILVYLQFKVQQFNDLFIKVFGIFETFLSLEIMGDRCVDFRILF